MRRKIQPLPEDPQIINSIGDKRYILQDQGRLGDGKDFGDIVYRDRRHSVEVAGDGQEVFLTIREKTILDLLIENSGMDVENETIALKIYRGVKNVTDLSGNVRKCIQGLRKKLRDGKENGNFRVIKTVPGGYKLVISS